MLNKFARSLAVGVFGTFGLVPSQAGAQLGSGWTQYSPPETLQVRGCAAHSASGGVDQFRVTCAMMGGDNRAEHRTMNDYSSGTNQFEGEIRVVTSGANIIVKQTFMPNRGAFFMMAVSADGRLYLHGGGGDVLPNVVGRWVKINTIHDVNAGTHRVYADGVLRTTKTGGPQVAWHDKYGSYRSQSGRGPAVIEWRNIKYFRGGRAPDGSSMPPPPPPADAGVPEPRADAATGSDGARGADAGTGGAGGAGGSGAGSGGAGGSGGATGGTGGATGGTGGSGATGGTGGTAGALAPAAPAATAATTGGTRRGCRRDPEEAAHLGPAAAAATRAAATPPPPRAAAPWPVMASPRARGRSPDWCSPSSSVAGDGAHARLQSVSFERGCEAIPSRESPALSPLGARHETHDHNSHHARGNRAAPARAGRHHRLRRTAARRPRLRAARPGRSPAIPNKLRVGFWGSHDRRARTEKAAALFTAATGIGVELEHYIPTQGAVERRLLADDEPARGRPHPAGRHAARLRLTSRSGPGAGPSCRWISYVADGTLNLSDVPAPMVDGGRVGGALMGVSLGTNTQAVVIDLDAFAAAGIPVPKDSWTWKDFETIALKLHKRLGIFGAGGSFHGYTPGWKAVYLSNGDWVFSPDGKALGYKEKDDKLWVDHWKMLLKLKREGALPRLDQEPTGSGVESMLIVTKQAAMDHLHSNQLVAMWTAANAAGTPRNFKLLPLPRIDDCSLSPVYIKPSQYFSITRDTTPEKRAHRRALHLVHHQRHPRQPGAAGRARRPHRQRGAGGAEAGAQRPGARVVRADRAGGQLRHGAAAQRSAPLDRDPDHRVHPQGRAADHERGDHPEGRGEAVPHRGHGHPGPPLSIWF